MPAFIIVSNQQSTLDETETHWTLDERVIWFSKKNELERKEQRKAMKDLLLVNLLDQPLVCWFLLKKNSKSIPVLVKYANRTCRVIVG